MARKVRRRCRCGEGRGEDVGARKAQRLVFFLYSRDCGGLATAAVFQAVWVGRP